MICDAGDAARNESSRAGRPDFVAMISAILMALRSKGESLAEKIACMRALDAHVGHLEVGVDRPRPVLLPSYSGLRHEPNLTPLLALLLKRYGVPVLVHGPDDGDVISLSSPGGGENQASLDASTFERVTTLEILLELGVEPARNLPDAQLRLTRQSITYVPTAVLAPGLAPLLGYRERLGVRSYAHSLARLIDPFHGDGYRVVGVAHPECLPRMREFLGVDRHADGIGTVCADTETCSVTHLPVLPAGIDARTTAAWITQALAGSIPVPAPIVTQLACCLQGTRGSMVRAA